MKKKSPIFSLCRFVFWPHLFFVMTLLFSLLMLGCPVSPKEESSGSSGTSLPLPKLRQVTYYDASGNMTHYIYMGTNVILNGKQYTVELNYNPIGELFGYYIVGVPRPGYGQWRGDPGEDGVFLTDDDYWSFSFSYSIGTKKYYFYFATFEKNTSYDEPYEIHTEIVKEVEIDNENNTTNITRFTTNDIRRLEDTYDESKNVIKRVCYTPGPDGELFTPDDEIPQLVEEWWGSYVPGGIWNTTPQIHAASYYVMTNSRKTMSLWWCWDTIKMYDGPGPDSNWFTEDDNIFQFARHEFNDPINPNYWTKEWVYTNAGPDGVWGTSDDKLYRFAIATNYY